MITLKEFIESKGLNYDEVKKGKHNNLIDSILSQYRRLITILEREEENGKTN